MWPAVADMLSTLRSALAAARLAGRVMLVVLALLILAAVAIGAAARTLDIPKTTCESTCSCFGCDDPTSALAPHTCPCCPPGGPCPTAPAGHAHAR